MKIAYFFDVPDYFGGAGSLLLKQAKLMSEIHEVLVVIPVNKDGTENIKCANWCDLSGLRHIGLEYTTAFRFRDIDLLNSVDSVDEICQLIEEEKIEFLHSAQINVAVELASRKENIPHLMNIYQLEENEFLFSQTDIYAHYHLCDSKKYSEIWKKNMDLVSDYMRPLSPIKKMRECKIGKKECYTIIMLGVLCERKNQLTAIRAVEQLQKKISLRMIIAGDFDNTYGKKCVEYVNNHGLQDMITFRGFVSDVGALLEEGDWFLLTSIDESFPSSIVEAVSYGLAIITTPVAGIPEVFKNGKNAFVSEGASVEDVTCLIEDCYNNCIDGRIAGIQSNAAETWRREFAPDNHKERLNDYYLSIVSDYYSGGKERHVDLDLIKEVENTAKLIGQRDKDSLFFRRKAFYYNYLLKNVHKQGNKKAYIWGAGMLGKIAYEFLKNFASSVDVIGFLDGNKEGEYQGLPIYNPGIMDWENSDCLVFIAYGGDVQSSVKQLEQKGFVLAENVWLMQ